MQAASDPDAEICIGNPVTDIPAGLALKLSTANIWWTKVYQIWLKFLSQIQHTTYEVSSLIKLILYIR